MQFLKRSVMFVTVMILSSFFAQHSQAAGFKTVHAATDSTSGSIDALVSFATKHLHIPYRSGGTSKRGFDCSGFVRYCFNKWDIALPHSSAAQAEHGKNIELTDAKPGDLIFFKGESAASKRIGHVGIITEVAPGYVKFIHSAFKGGVRYDLLNASYYAKRFVAVKRVLQSVD